MSNLRKLGVKLGQRIDDRINQKLGYREYEVTPPSGIPINPRPLVRQVDINRISEAMAAQLLQSSQDAVMPNALYTVQLSREFSYAEFTEGGSWFIKRDDWEEATECAIAHHLEKDYRIELTLQVLKDF